MNYVEFEPPGDLKNHVLCLWRLRDGAPEHNAQTVYPDGRCELMVHLGTPMARHRPETGWVPQAPVLFAGQLTRAIRLAARGPLDCVGVRIRPEASAGMAGTAVAALRDHVVDLAGVDAAFAGALARGAATLASGDDPEALHEILRDRCTRSPVDPAIVVAVEQIDATLGQVTVSDLAAATGLAARTLQTRFLAAVGLPAKTYARIVRLQATIDALDRGEAPIAAVAVDRGFADQAHATREITQVTGLPPARLRTALREARSDEGTVRMAAAFVRGSAGSG
ncbi:MAG: AraC family transcriptional regulator [Pseudomonadota bacterium]